MSIEDKIKMTRRSNLLPLLILVIFLTNNIPQSLASFEAEIIPQPVYTVYVNQSYTLTVNVQYEIPFKTIEQIGPIEFWISSALNASDKVRLEGSGVHPFELHLVAPSQQGDHVFEINLHVNSKQHKDAILDTSVIKCKVAQPILNDWAITKVWITPESTTPGSEVTFHATVVLKNSSYLKYKALHVARVGFYLDGDFFSGVFLRFDPNLPATFIQETQAQETWIAEEGSHRLRVLVSDNNQFPDPFLNDNEIEIIFSSNSSHQEKTSIMPEGMGDKSILESIKSLIESMFRFFKDLFP